jgi:hypothetical protein
MKIFSSLFVLLLTAITWSLPSHASPAPEFCNILRAFVDSVRPNENREFKFRTSWGSNFKDTQEPAIFAKRCEHGGYGPAEKVCAYLMEYGSTEFTGANVKDAVSCLSPQTVFDRRLNLNEADFHFNYGSENRGSLIDVTFKADPVVGGMVFRLAADGH